MNDVTTLTGWQLFSAIIASWIVLITCICLCAFSIESCWNSFKQGFDPDSTIVLFYGHLHGHASGEVEESATIMTQRDSSSSTDTSTVGQGDSSSLIEILVQP